MHIRTSLRKRACSEKICEKFLQKFACENNFCSDKRAFGKIDSFRHREDGEKSFLPQEGNDEKSAYGETSIFWYSEDFGKNSMIRANSISIGAA